MPKKTTRTRTVKSPKVKGSLSAKKLERAIRIVVESSSASTSTQRKGGRERAASAR